MGICVCFVHSRWASQLTCTWRRGTPIQLYFGRPRRAKLGPPVGKAAIGYEPDAPLEGNLLGIAKNQIAVRFDCLSTTLEMPYKDCRTDQDPIHGWSRHRSYMLGASLLDPLLYVHAFLRAEGGFKKQGQSRCVRLSDEQLQIILH